MRNINTIKHSSYSAVLITQGDYKFYSAVLPIDALGATCFVSTREEEPEIGFQRVLDEGRAKQIADYIDSGKGTIPTAVILSAQQESEFNYDSKTKTLSFKAIPKAFLVLDGQHRIWGFKMAQTSMRVPVIIYAGLNRMQESRLFIDINTKQRPVPNELLLDIKKLADYESDVELYLGTLFDLFVDERISALKGRMSPSKRQKGSISRVTFYRALKPIFSKIADNPADSIFPVLNAYLEAVLTGLKNKKVEESFYSPTIFGAFILLFPEIVSIVSDKFGKEHYKRDRFEEVLVPIFERIKTNKFTTPGNSAYVLYEEFSKQLRSQKIHI